MLLVVRSRLLIVKDGAFANTSVVRAQFFGLSGNCRQRDALLVLAERINALFHQINGPLAKFGVDLFFSPGM